MCFTRPRLVSKLRGVLRVKSAGVGQRKTRKSLFGKINQEVILYSLASDEILMHTKKLI